VKTLRILILLAVVGSLVLSACGKETVEVTRVVKETVVEKETVTEKETVVQKETVVETVTEKETVVQKETVVEKETVVQKEIVEVTGAIPYPEGVPLGTGPEAVRYSVDQVLTYKALDSYSQPAWMDALVAAGTLPPVEERLPDEPQVMLTSGMSTGVGQYGGVWRDFSACPTEGWNNGAGQTQGWFGINIIYEEALLITGPLFRSDKVEPWPNLAKSWEWSDDGLELTMHLIEGAKWSDGEPFSADDVMFTWEHLILDPGVSSSSTSRSAWQIGGEDISLEKVDDYTIKWTFPVPFPVQKMFIMDEYDFAVWPEHVWAPLHPAFNADTDYESFEKSWPPDKLPPIGMGPWIAVEYRTDELMVLRRNPYYWKVDESGQQLPYLDEVVFEKGSTGVGRTLSTLAGSGDHSNLENPSTFNETLSRAAEPDAHFSVIWGPEMLSFSLHMNQSANLGVQNERDAALRELFRNQTFRRAVSHAIDRDGIAQAIIRGPFLRAWPGGLYPGSTEYDRASVVYYPYSPDTAITLLANLGFEDTDGDGILNWTEGPLAGDNLVIALIANEDQAESTSTAEALVPLMADVGIQINYRPVKPTVATDAEEAGTWEWHVDRGGQAYAVPFSYADQLAPVRKEQPAWHREGEEPRELQPFEQQLVDIVNEFALEPDDAKRKELMFEYNRIFTENVYDVGVIIGRYGLALAKRFNNVPIGSTPFLYQWTWANVNPEQIWVAPEEQLPQIRPNEVPLYGE
jgi:peptide/nickel transport system substrate-binding protein